MLPNKVVTAITIPDPTGPVPESGVNVTVTLAGVIVPAGNPLPVKVTRVAPGWAAAGVALALSVTTADVTPVGAAVTLGGAINNQHRRIPIQAL